MSGMSKAQSTARVPEQRAQDTKTRLTMLWGSET